MYNKFKKTIVKYEELNITSKDLIKSIKEVKSSIIQDSSLISESKYWFDFELYYNIILLMF